MKPPKEIAFAPAKTRLYFAPMKIQPPFLICAAALLALNVRFGFADTIILNSGETLEGKVISESATQMVLDIQISAGITDQRTVAKKDVKSIVKVSDDEIAYNSIKGYTVGPNSYTPNEYEALVRALGHFLSKYPTSPHGKDVKANLEAITQEKTRVDGGQMKWSNRWYTAEEAVQQKYQIDAEKVYGTMKDLAARQDTVGALNTFDFLEKNYGGSIVFPTAVETALALTKRLEVEVERAAVTGKQQEAQFNSGIVLASEPQKSQAIAARKAQVQSAESAVEMAQHTFVKWPPLLPITQKSPAALKTSIDSEVPRLTMMPVTAMRNSISMAEAAIRALKAGDLATADSNCKEAEQLWPTNDMCKRIEDSIAAIKRRPTPTPTPAHTPTPAPAAASKAKTAKP